MSGNLGEAPNLTAITIGLGLTTDEYEQLRRTTDSYRDELIIRLGGEVGLRSFEIPQITPEHPHREVIEDDNYHFLRVPEGKDTSGNGGKPRGTVLEQAESGHYRCGVRERWISVTSRYRTPRAGTGETRGVTTLPVVWSGVATDTTV